MIKTVSLPCTITAPHCELCGSTSPEDLNGPDAPYTVCCNELQIFDKRECDGHFDATKRTATYEDKSTVADVFNAKKTNIASAMPLTRKRCLEILAELNYTGPTSYTVTKLRSIVMLALQN